MADRLGPTYDEQARPQFELPTATPDLAAIGQDTMPRPDFDEDELAARLWIFDLKLDRFTFKASADLVVHPRCTTALALRTRDRAHARLTLSARNAG